MKNKEEIISKLKENKKYVALIIIVSIITTVILIPTVLIIDKQQSIDALYDKAKNGILIEDQFLEHAEIVDYGGTTGRVLEYTDGFTFKIYAKAGDWCHVHYISWNSAFSPIWFEMNAGTWAHGWNFGFVKSQTFQIDESSTYTIGVYNYDDDNDGYITFFLIVYTNEYYPPECPLC